MIEPRCLPIIEVVDYHNKGIHLLYLKCSPGDAGPYKAPADVYSKKDSEIKPDKSTKYWIRPVEELLISVEVANEMDTELAIRNIGLMMFADSPDRFIPGVQIDLVKFNSEEAEASDDFIEKTFEGPIWKQVRGALEYINTSIIEEKVVKIKNRAEFERFYNYPYNALEESIANSVFHKSYKEPEPVEIRIYVDCIQIINYPGPAKWIDMNKFATGKVRARKYRNRRI